MRSPSVGLVIAVAFAAGCGGGRKAVGPLGAGGMDGGPIVLDAPVDAVDAPVHTDNFDGGAPADVLVHDAADAAADVPADALSSLVAFVFTNSTGRTIYIQTSDFSGQAYWSMVEGGKRLPVDNTCEVCDCRMCPSCWVCGRSIARVKALAPGAQHEWTWDGRIWERVANGCRADLACEQDQVIPAGAALDVTVTYSSSFAVDTSLGADDELIGTPLTATAAFTNAPGASIAITATQ